MPLAYKANAIVDRNLWLSSKNNIPVPPAVGLPFVPISEDNRSWQIADLSAP